MITDQVDPHGRPYLWIGGQGPTWSRDQGTDYAAVEEGFVILTPLMVDLTHYGLHQEMKGLERDGLPPAPGAAPDERLRRRPAPHGPRAAGRCAASTTAACCAPWRPCRATCSCRALLHHRAHQACALPIGFGQTISKPFTVGLMSGLLELQGHERVLEIGTGSGYQAAVLSRAGREVVTVERVAPLAAPRRPVAGRPRLRERRGARRRRPRGRARPRALRRHRGDRLRAAPAVGAWWPS